MTYLVHGRKVAYWGEAPQAGAPGCYPGRCWFESNRPSHFYTKRIVTYVETFAELTVLAMAMFLAAFFCFRVILLPDASKATIEKIYEVEETLYQGQ